MRAVVQRVSEASVTVDSTVVAQIGPGLLVLVGVAVGDQVPVASKMAAKIAALRIFPDEAGKMDLSVSEVGGEVLLVSQFTLYGDTRSGNRPSFTGAAPGATAEPLFDQVASYLEVLGLPVSKGVFGARMEVALVNDGPVTILLET